MCPGPRYESVCKWHVLYSTISHQFVDHQQQQEDDIAELFILLIRVNIMLIMCCWACVLSVCKTGHQATSYYIWKNRSEKFFRHWMARICPTFPNGPFLVPLHLLDEAQNVCVRVPFDLFTLLYCLLYIKGRFLLADTNWEYENIYHLFEIFRWAENGFGTAWSECRTWPCCELEMLSDDDDVYVEENNVYGGWNEVAHIRANLYMTTRTTPLKFVRILL